MSQPLVSDSKYDFIADVNGSLYKIQVKTSSVNKEEGYIQFATSTSHTNTKGTKNIKYSSKDVDFFATIFEGDCYVVPIKDCGSRAKRLRIKPTKNGQIDGISFAKDYLLNKIFPND